MSGEWLVLLAAVLWGTTGTAQALAPASAAPPSIGAARLAVGGLALLLLAWQKDPKGFRNFSGLILSRRTDPKWDQSGQKQIAFPVILASVCMAAYQLTFFAAVRRTGVAVGTVVAIGSAPVLAGILGNLIQHERPPGRWWPATLLAVAGCGLLFLPGGDVSVNLPGILLALGAGLSYAIFAVINKRLLAVFSPDVFLAVVFCLAALLLLPVWFTADMRWLFELRGQLVALHLGLLATATAYALFARGLARASLAATAVTLSLAEPLTAATLGLTLLGERLTPSMAEGILLILVGLAVLTIKR